MMQNKNIYHSDHQLPTKFREAYPLMTQVAAIYNSIKNSKINNVMQHSTLIWFSH